MNGRLYLRKDLVSGMSYEKMEQLGGFNGRAMNNTQMGTPVYIRMADFIRLQMKRSLMGGIC
ncbi:hypothetical protein M3226_20495 [Neobacillus cucumis]|uniref:hypothetical protein n=1 Tax=Neobacillus cucumis TaxID=1740721 RepID=UPI00203F710F|nr:hypothetical protein [Neobacillus cucumis]MCM3728031.1 hypothetical protein [Neobacillus cucumis]